MKKIFLLTVFVSLFALAANAQKITYNFNDKSWGEPATERPKAGSFNSSDVNGIKFTHAELFQKDGKGSIRVILDKKSTLANIEFPEFEGNSKCLIEAMTGTEGRPMKVEEKVNGKWQAIGEPIELTKEKAIYSFDLSEGATQIRIVNWSSSALYIYKVTIM